MTAAFDANDPVELERFFAGLPKGINHEHEGVGDHRVVRGIGVFLDAEVLLDDPVRVTEERPFSAGRRAELLTRVMQRHGCGPVVTRAPSEPFGSTLGVVNRRRGHQKGGYPNE